MRGKLNNEEQWQGKKKKKKKKRVFLFAVAISVSLELQRTTKKTFYKKKGKEKTHELDIAFLASSRRAEFRLLFFFFSNIKKKIVCHKFKFTTSQHTFKTRATYLVAKYFQMMPQKKENGKEQNTYRLYRLFENV